MVYGIGITEILIVLIVVLLLFGPKRLPELAKSLGKSVNEFKNAMHGKKGKLQG